MKPDWKDAPEWAQWLAQDQDGEWFWFEIEPQLFKTVWAALSGRSYQAHEPFQYQDSLEGRPS